MTKFKALSAGGLFVLLLFLLGGAAFAQQMMSQNPELRFDYAPPGNQVLATSALGSIPETDLLLYLALSLNRNPNVFARFMDEKNPEKKKEYKQNFKDAVQSYMIMWKMSREAPAAAEPENIAALRLRIKSYPAYEMVWIEKVLRPLVAITDGDIRAYYDEHKEKYLRPASASLRLMFLAAPLNQPELDRQKARIRIEELREQAIAGAPFEALVRENSSPFPDANPDGVMNVQKSKTYNRFYEEADAIEEGAFSPVFQREEGFFFLQCLKKNVEEITPLEEVQNQIRAELEIISLRHLYTFEWNKLDKKYLPHSLWAPWDESKDNDLILKAGSLKITKGEFWQLFPEVIGVDMKLDDGTLRSKTNFIKQYECIRQEIENLKISDHPWIVIGEAIAREMIAADHYMAQHSHPLKVVTQEDMKAFYETHPELSTTAPWRETAQLIGSLKQADRFAPDVIMGVRERMYAAYTACLAEAGEIIAAQRKALEENNQPVSYLPGGLFAGLSQKYSTNEFSIDVYDLGKLEPQFRPAVWKIVKDLPVGEFSPVERGLNTRNCYYIAKRYEGERLPLSKIKDKLRDKILTERFAKATKETGDELLKQSALVFEPILK